jgi:hypothetical protein
MQTMPAHAYNRSSARMPFRTTLARTAHTVAHWAQGTNSGTTAKAEASAAQPNHRLLKWNKGVKIGAIGGARRWRHRPDRIDMDEEANVT